MTGKYAKFLLRYYIIVLYFTRVDLEGKICVNKVTDPYRNITTASEHDRNYYDWNSTSHENTFLVQRCQKDVKIVGYRSTIQAISMLKDLLRFEKWDHVHILYNYNYFVDIAGQLSNVNLLVSLHNINNNVPGKNITVQIMEVFKSIASSRSELHFIVFGESDFLVALLQQIKLQDGLYNQQGYFTFLHKWIFVISCQTNLLDIEEGLGNINHITIVSCIDFNTPNLKFMDIYSAMWTPVGRKLELIGQIQHGNITTTVYKTLFPNVPYHFNGQHLTIATQLWSGYMDRQMEGNTTQFSGPYFSLIEACSLHLNFSYDIIIPNDGTWGGKLRGKWYGIPALLLNKSADISIAPLTFLYERAQVMDFADVPIQYSSDVVLHRKLTPIRNTLSLYAKPFKSEVWIGILTIMIIHTFIILLVSQIINHGQDTRRDGISRECATTNCRSYSVTLQSILSSFLNQGVIVEIKYSSQAILWASWWLFSWIMVSVWAGVLISFLTVTVYPWFPSTLEELAYDSTHKIGVTGASAAPSMLKSSKKPELAQIWQKIKKDYKEDPTILSTKVDVHINNILSKDYLFITDADTVDILKTKKCNIDSNDALVINVVYFSIGMQKNSAYKSLFSHFSMLIMEFGIMDVWLKSIKENRNDTVCTDPDDNVSHRLELHHFMGWFIVLGVLLAIALVTLLLEHLWLRFKGFKTKVL